MFSNIKSHKLINIILRRLLTVLVLILPSYGFAHPHILISTKIAYAVNDRQEIFAIDYQWTFDPAFSTFMIHGFDKNNDGFYSREELSELAKTNMESLVDYNYFTDVVPLGKNDDVDEKDGLDFLTPTDYWLSHNIDDQTVTLHYRLPFTPALPIDAQKRLLIDVYDPEYFIAFSLASDNPVKKPEQCPKTEIIQPPNLDFAVAQTLADIGQDEGLPEDLQAITTTLINRVILSCQ